jgi:hypothetical protein
MGLPLYASTYPGHCTISISRFNFMNRFLSKQLERESCEGGRDSRDVLNFGRENRTSKLTWVGIAQTVRNSAGQPHELA